MKRISWTRAALIALMLSLAAPGGSALAASATEFPMTVENCGEQVTVPREPKRIVTFGHEAVELIDAAGGADRIVGTFANTKDPGSPAFDAASNAELVSDEEANTEDVLALRPDLLVSYGLFDVSLPALQQAGAASLIVSGLCGQHGGGVGDGAQFEDIYHDIQTYGQLMGTQDQAQTAVEALQQRVAAVTAGAAVADGTTAAHGYFFGNEFSTSGNQSVAQAQMDALGLTNVFADVDKDFIEGNTEELIKRDPEIMILTFDVPDETFEQAKEKFLALPGAEDMQAVRNDRIIPLPYTQTQASVSAITGLETIAHGLERLGDG